jgi:RpiB/LacA/LacB family sugar-phosphate isomerase
MPHSLILGADHAGYALKEALRPFLAKQASIRELEDLTADFHKDDDYPVAANLVAKAVASDPNALGLLVCGTGHGMEIAANRTKGIRAVVARTEEDARLAREHNHANVLVLGGWVTSPAKAKRLVAAWLETNPSTAARHKRRISQLDEV